MIRPPPKPTLFPYPTLSRSARRAPFRPPAPPEPSRVRTLPHLHSSNGRPTPSRSPPGPGRDPAAQRPLARTLLRSEEHTSELQSRQYLVCRLLLEKKKNHSH